MGNLSINFIREPAVPRTPPFWKLFVIMLQMIRCEYLSTIKGGVKGEPTVPLTSCNACITPAQPVLREPARPHTAKAPSHQSYQPTP